MNITAGKTDAFSAALFSQLSSYGHKVFIETLGWDLQTRTGEELDQFDHPDTRYVVSKTRMARSTDAPACCRPTARTCSATCFRN